MSTSDQQHIQRSARRFAQETLVPNAAAWERAGGAPDAVVTAMAELGLFGLLVPEEFGGSGVDVSTFLLAMEEIAAGDAGLSTLMHVHGLGVARTIVRNGSDQQKRRWLPGIASGETIGCFCLTEPQAGSDTSAIATKAVRVAGGWRLSGTKVYITNGARAKLALVIAVTDDESPKKGISAFLVPTETDGFAVGRIEQKMGQVTSDTAEVVLDDCFVPEEGLFGPLHRAMPMALSLLADGRVSVAAQAVGIARAALDHALRHAQERRSFGKPLIEHQALAFRLADMATKVEITRAFAHEVGRMIDRGENALKQASMAKLFGGLMVEEVCSAAIDIHGGAGYIRGTAVERLYRDAKVCQIYEGTSDIQRLVIARQLVVTS